MGEKLDGKLNRKMHKVALFSRPDIEIHADPTGSGEAGEEARA